jgi:hypothetical protein
MVARVSLTACVLAAAGLIFGCGLLVGGIICEGRAYTARFLEEQEAVAPILAADPAFAHVTLIARSSGGIDLGGTVPTQADLDRLRSQVARALGEPRSRVVTLAVMVAPVVSVPPTQ